MRPAAKPYFAGASGTMLFTDLLQQIPADRLSGWRAMVAKLDHMVGPEPSVPRKFRVAFTNRRAARAALDRILASSPAISHAGFAAQAS